MTGPANLLVVAGEVSGDMLAARLVRAVRARLPQARFFGVGGAEMREAGVETLYDARDMAVMGFSEVVRRLPHFFRVFRGVLAAARARRPDAAILVDYAGFNLRLAARLHAAGIKTVYYVCPKFWAWNRRRLPKMARTIDTLISIFPFEAAHFSGTGLRVVFAGHPFADDARRELARPPADLSWPGTPRVAILPGSRPHEIARILPVLWGAAAEIEKRHGAAGFLVASPGRHEEAIAREAIAALRVGPSRWRIVTGTTREVLRQADAAWVASGTATLEAALMSCPTVVTYRVAALTYLLGRLLIRVPHIGLVNLLAGRGICPELIQRAATPRSLADAIDPLLRDGPERRRMVADLRAAAATLGAEGAAGRAADAVVEALRG